MFTRLFFILLFTVISIAASVHASDFDIPDHPEFRQTVQFWIDIYSKYGSRQGVIHDADNVNRIYEIIEFQSEDQKKRSRLIKEVKKKWRKVLLSIHNKRAAIEKLNDEELKAYKLFPEEEGVKRFAQAAGRKRLRFQLGQRDHFQSAIIQSGRYLRLMEEVFKNEGLPTELTRLPFVESSFNLKARSKVGASGIWQFMRTTGRLFLKIDPSVDERNDPIRATEAAARLLKQNYESLGSWPLAVIAYNHGRMGMMRASSKVGSNNIKDVLLGYRSRSFGFASKNFFWELVAAIHVEKQKEGIFGSLETLPLLNYTPVSVKDSITVRDLAQGLGLTLHEFQEYNPAFTDQLLRGRRAIPAGYPIRIPDEWGKDKGGVQKAFQERYALIPPKFKRKRQF